MSDPGPGPLPATPSPGPALFAQGEEGGPPGSAPPRRRLAALAVAAIALASIGFAAGVALDRDDSPAETPTTSQSVEGDEPVAEVARILLPSVVQIRRG